MDNNLLKKIKSFNLSFIDYIVVDNLYSSFHKPLILLVDNVYQNARDIGFKTNKKHIEERIHKLIKEHYVISIDDNRLKQIKAFLSISNIVPVYGWPNIGDLDLTPKGYIVVDKIINDIFFDNGSNLSCSTYYYDCDNYVYGITQKDCSSFATSLIIEGQISKMGKPFPSGSWSDRWWRIYPQGYKCEIEWCPGPTTYDNPSDEKSNPAKRGEKCE